MREFDVLVWGLDESETHEPPFKDRALEFHFTNSFNRALKNIDAEWVVLAHKSINIDREFLNSLAIATGEYPMVDAFSPRIRTKDGNFVSGFTLDSRLMLKMIPENSAMRFVASPHPYIVAFSSRIIQRTGAFDTCIQHTAQIADYSLRMLHAGGVMFSLPYLVASTIDENANVPGDNIYSGAERELLYAKVKSFGIFENIPYIALHPCSAMFCIRHRKELLEKRNKAILLSKLEKNFLQKIR